MPDNTNVNNNSAVVVVGRTAPVPPGQQKSEKSIPVVVASDQSAIPVEEQNKVQSEVALSLLGIPRSEVALGIFADVNTYDINPTEWTSTPEQYATAANPGDGDPMGWGLTHVPEESGALLEAPADESAVLTSKRFFRYQPGRVSSATFGVKTTTLNNDGSNIQNPAIRKYGIFDNYDGYYWETRNDGQGDNFCVVRRTQSILLGIAVTFGSEGNEQSQDYGTTSYYDPLEARGSEALGDPVKEPGIDAEVPGYKRRQLGDLVILRDRLLMTHAAVYDPTLLQPKHLVGITSVTGGNTLTCAGLAKSITNAVYNINTGLMVITTAEEHGYHNGKFLTLAGIGMTCDINPSQVKYYPNRVFGYNIVRVDSPTSFTVNVGVSTVPTNYVSGGYAVGLSTGQYVSYTKGTATSAIGNLTDTAIYKVKTVGLNTTTGITTLTLTNCDNQDITGITNFSGYTGIQTHCLETPVPFVQPRNNTITSPTRTKYTTIQPTGMFPYMYIDDQNNEEGYIDTSKTTQTTDLKTQIDQINTYYKKWVNQNVDIKYWGVYEYRVPRSRFSGDRLDNATDALLYSDAVGDNKPGDPVQDSATNEALTDVSIWDLEFDKVTMYKVEFSWYGAVGALFLAYVPVSNGEARWVRVHHLRASNQLKVASLGNATLPITYLVYGGGNQDRYGYGNNDRPESAFSYGSPSEHIIKYGASYYIDGGDRGTVKLFSFATPTTIDVFGSKRTVTSASFGIGSTQLNLNDADNATDPYIIAGASSGFSSSYYIGSKVITDNPLDQNIEINYYNASNGRLYLNSPLNDSSSLQTLTIIPNRVTPLVGIKCRDFIQSSTGRDVRNRTQVYPTRLSTGSTGVIKVDLLKSPIFQTDSIVVNDIGPNLSVETNIGKRSKPTVVDLPLRPYTGTHTFVPGSSSLTDAIKVVTNGGGSASAGDTPDIVNNTSGAVYNSSTGIVTFTTATHGLAVGATIRIKKESLTFTCSLDNNATNHSYPRTTDPIFDNIIDSTGGSAGYGGSLDGDYSLIVTVLTVPSPTQFTVRVTNASGDAASSAEYIRDIGGGAYGYFRGYFETDPTQKPISVLGYLENRGKDRTKGIDTDGYYFYALNSTSENIVLTTATPFVREEFWSPSGTLTTGANTEQTLAQLSSVKVNQRNESPIPGTGTVVASLFIPASGEEFDLSSYFDYNKEYLSFPLTDKVDSLYVCGSSQSNYTAGTPKAEVEASLTWEEQ